MISEVTTEAATSDHSAWSWAYEVWMLAFRIGSVLFQPRISLSRVDILGI